MNSRQLQIFLAVYDGGSFSAAARQLYLSQSVVSRHIAALEDMVGNTLLVRGARGVTPTPAGDLLAGYARRLSAVTSEAKAALSGLKEDGTEPLRIGASLTIGNYLLPRLLTTFHQRYPDIEIELSVANTETTQQQLSSDDLDVALTEGFVDTDVFNADSFTDDQLVVVAAPGADVARLQHPTLAQLMHYPCVVRERGSGTRAVVEKALAERGFTLRHSVSMGSTEAVKGAVIAGAGFTITSLRTVEDELAAGSLVRLRPNHFFLHRPLHLVQRKDHPASAAVANFIALLNDPDAC
ncbi:LysR substrate-binding domain-containing protein [Salinisphaera aquimarina]|uniref:LysR substrate-binding domain-containing protein n=1 Tax=Salinisphaera aquimarina TaxID=2094031 RepID=A0ABV7EQT1_9GAMM